MKIIFDVGANDGINFLREAKDHPDTVQVYAFEPSKTAYAKLIANIKDYGVENNFFPFNIAISDVNEDQTFNESSEDGCSSLLPFVNDVNIRWRHDDPRWGVYRDFKYIDSYDIPVRRLDWIIERFNISHIDLLHIDAQGNDLKVLHSLGKYIDIVRAGDAETSSTHETALYDNANTYEETTEFLHNNGFTILSTGANDQFGFEINIFFSRE